MNQNGNKLKKIRKNKFSKNKRNSKINKKNYLIQFYHKKINNNNNNTSRSNTWRFNNKKKIKNPIIEMNIKNK